MKTEETVGAFEAGSKFPELLERVGDGAEITITLHDKPVAKLVPFETPRRKDLPSLFSRLEAFRARHPLNPNGADRLTYRDLIAEGRER